MQILRIGIVGSRRRHTLSDRKIVFEIVEKAISKNPDKEIILVSGACHKGADAFAAEAARVYNVKIVEYPVPKVQYKHRGEFAKAAYARNRLIAENSDMGFALVSPDRTGGTENTIRHYVDLKKKVYLVDQDGSAYLVQNGTKDTDQA